MTPEKKLTLRRILIFLALTFVPVFVITPLLGRLAHLSFSGEAASAPLATLFGTLVMLVPAAASLLTRRLTGEGMQESYLRSHFKDKIVYYLLAIVIPVAYGNLGALLAKIVLNEPYEVVSGSTACYTMLSQIPVAIIMSFFALGEELGWRGYLMPKLEKLFSLPVSILLGGFLWALWQLPMLMLGLHFGDEFKRLPDVCFAVMILFCVVIGCILTLLTRQTQSVYPAAIAHMMQKQVVPTILLLTLYQEAIAEVGSAKLMALMLVPAFVVALVLLLKMQCKK